MNIRTRQQRGFTLVELLIVIVIIAILAAITIVAYNGIQQRAKLTQQTAALDKIGRAINLWSAQNGHSLGQSGVGYNGQGYGGFTATAATNGASYRDQSIQDLLSSAEYFKPSAHDSTAFALSNVLLTPCTTTADSRWVVLATVSPVPQQPIADQIAASGCANSTLSLYTAAPYSRNLIKAY